MNTLNELEDILYFAYGSNLDESDLLGWCSRHGLNYPLGECLGRARLPDHELAFDRYSSARNGGVLDCRMSPGRSVEGALFVVLPGGWSVLDRKEGHPGAYVRRETSVVDQAGNTVRVMTYFVAMPALPLVPPSRTYLDIVRKGLASRGIPADELHRAVDAAKERR